MPATACIGGFGRSFLFQTELNGRTGRHFDVLHRLADEAASEFGVTRDM
jgi:hypothetical protein